MATSSSVVDVSSFTTDAKFRTWGAAVSAAIVASGLTVTADTGQINWTTVVKPTVANTKAGYEIYRFNDSLQSSAPVFLRVDYGTAVGALAFPMTWLTTGTGSDGAGNITGVLTGPNTGNSSAGSGSTNAAATVRASYSSSAGAAFIDSGMSTGGGGQNSGCWVIQRTCDGAGAPSGAGAAVTLLRGSGPGVATQWPVSFAPYAIFASRNPAVGVLNTGATSVSGGGVIELYRNYITCPTPLGTLGSFGYLTGDITAGAVFVSAPWGAANHTYLAVGQAGSGPFEQAGSTNISAAVIWE